MNARVIFRRYQTIPPDNFEAGRGIGGEAMPVMNLLHLAPERAYSEYLAARGDHYCMGLAL